jgi:hypothetical protein
VSPLSSPWWRYGRQATATAAIIVLIASVTLIARG